MERKISDALNESMRQTVDAEEGEAVIAAGRCRPAARGSLRARSRRASPQRKSQYDKNSAPRSRALSLRLGRAHPRGADHAQHILCRYEQFGATTDVCGVQPRGRCRLRRIFWEKGAAAAGLPLRALESGRRADEFDVWAYTISWEMDYFNVVDLLRQAGIPPLAEERRDAALGRQLLAAADRRRAGRHHEPGTNGAVFDAILIGEGEQAIPQFIDLCREGLYEDRDALLAALDGLPGWYVPAKRPSHRDHPHFRRVERLWVRELAEYDATSTLYTPDTEFADMHLMEIARGCGRGCRFCLAGYVYRPAREQPLERLLASAERAVAQGYRRVGLVSATVSDHTQIDELATQLQAMGVAISASSMRMDPISVPLIRAMAASGAQTLTVAPGPAASVCAM